MRRAVREDIIAKQLTIGSLVYLADYVPIEGVTRITRCTMIPRILDDYWLQYIRNQGMKEVDTIPVNDVTLNKLPDLTQNEIGWGIDGTEFAVATRDEKEPYICHVKGDIRLFQVKYIHQLQIAYSLLCGANLDVSRLFKSLRKYRDPKRDIK